MLKMLGDFLGFFGVFWLSFQIFFDFFFRVVTPEEGYEKAHKYDALWVESSAKTGQGIQELFRDVTTILLNGNLDSDEASKKPNTEQG